MARSPNNPKRAARFYQRKTSQDRHHEPTNGPTAHDLTTRLFGIDFWHAVEFSRIKRAPPQTFRPSVGATAPTYLLDLRSVNFGCQPLRAVSLRPAGRPVDNSTRSSEGPRPPLVPTTVRPALHRGAGCSTAGPPNLFPSREALLGRARWPLSAARSSGPYARKARPSTRYSCGWSRSRSRRVGGRPRCSSAPRWLRRPAAGTGSSGPSTRTP